jgi:hypothetical protein
VEELILEEEDEENKNAHEVQISNKHTAACSFVLLDVDAVAVCVVPVCKAVQWLLDVSSLAQF